jgi:hypothetical protein
MVDDYHGQRKMILNKNDSLIKNDKKESHFLNVLFQNAFIGNDVSNIHGSRDSLA